MVIGHAVVGEDAEGDDYHYYLSGEDFRLVARVDGSWTRRAIWIKEPLFLFADVDGIEGTVGVSAEVNARVCCRPRCSHERCLCRRMIQLFLCAPCLHVWMSLDQKEVAENDAN